MNILMFMRHSPSLRFALHSETVPRLVCQYRVRGLDFILTGSAYFEDYVAASLLALSDSDADQKGTRNFRGRDASEEQQRSRL
jgi:hypothetical protein